MLRKLRKMGQTTAEYAIVISIVIAAAIAMQVYTKRTIAGSIKYAVDRLQKDSTAANKLYEPYYLKSDYDVTTSAYTETEQTKEGGETIRTLGDAAAPMTTIRTGKTEYRDASKKD